MLKTEMRTINKNPDEYKEKAAVKKVVEEYRGDMMLKVKQQFEEVIAKLKEEIKDAPIQIAKL
jgi:hypothetical protein